MPSVFEKQNEPEMQMLLCAQRKEYSKVKRGRFWFLFVSVIVVAGLTIWVAITDNSKVDSVLTVLNVGIIFLRERIMRIFEKKQEFAAQIQQYFDSSCYNTAIGKEMIDGESLFTESKIAEIQAGVCHEDLSDFANWYSDYRSKPAEKQILYSQRENLLWDEKLRLLYRTTIIILLTLISSTIIIYGIKSSAPFEKMCALISCILVFIECAWDSIEKITRDLRRLNKLFAQYEETEKAVCSSKIRSQKKLSDLQNEIFTHRKESFLIPDFVYKLRKKNISKKDRCYSRNAKSKVMEQLMEKKQLISVLERLANEGDNIVESAKSLPISSFKSEMFCRFPSFMEWRSAVLTILKQNGLHKNEFAYQIEKISENTAARKVYVEAAVQQLKGLKKAYEQDYLEIDNNKAKGDVSDLENIFNKFTRVVRQLRSRHDNRETLTIKDEYDVQDLLHALLVLHFDDVRAEEWTPSYAGGCERMDFLLKDLQTVIEVKKTRSSMSKKELGEELITDIEKYKVHPDCKQLYCFIYDPDGYLGNSFAIKNDLEKAHQGFVKIFIRPEV